MWITSKRYLGRGKTSKCRVAKKTWKKYQKMENWVIYWSSLPTFYIREHDRNLNETCVSISGSSCNLFIKLKAFFVVDRYRFFPSILLNCEKSFILEKKRNHRRKVHRIKSNKPTEKKDQKPLDKASFYLLNLLAVAENEPENVCCLPTWRQFPLDSIKCLHSFFIPS